MNLKYEFPEARSITDDRGYCYWNTWKWTEYESNKSGEYIPSSSLVVEMIEICKPLFDGSLTYTETVVKPDGTTEEVTKNYPAIDSNLNLVDYFLENYGDKILKFPACKKCYNEEQNLVIMSTGFGRSKRIMSNYMYSNKYKILTLLRTTDYKYNPIENYNMVESYNSSSNGNTDTSSDSYLGTIEHTVEGKTKQGPELNSVETVTTKSTTFDNTNEAGLRIVDQVETSPVTSETSYDNYKQSDIQTEDNKSHSYGMSTYNDTDKHTLKRSGNIGVTTTQQMLEQERNIAQLNIVKEFFDGFQKTITLDIWY